MRKALAQKIVNDANQTHKERSCVESLGFWRWYYLPTVVRQRLFLLAHLNNPEITIHEFHLITKQDINDMSDDEFMSWLEKI